MIALIKPFLPLILKAGLSVLLLGSLIAWFQVTRAENRALKAEVASYEQAYITNRQTIEKMQEYQAKQAKFLQQHLEDKKRHRETIERLNAKLSTVFGRDGVADWANSDIPNDVDDQLRQIEDHHDNGNSRDNAAYLPNGTNGHAAAIGEDTRGLSAGIRTKS